MFDTKKKGFTLVELIVVIAIIGVLSMILIPSLTGYVRKAKRTADIAAARKLYQDIELILIENDEVFGTFYNVINGSGKNEGWKAKEPDTGEEYPLIAVARMAGTKDGPNTKDFPYQWQATHKEESQPFVDELNKREGITDETVKNKELSAPIKLKAKNANGKYADSWVICYRKDNSTIEVWSACSSLSWSNMYTTPNVIKGYIMYRLWPNPDPEYK